MGYWGWRRYLPRKSYPAASQQSGGNPTLGRADTSRVGLPSLWFGPHTSSYGGPGCRHKRSVCRSRSGSTAPEWNSSDRRAGKTPKPREISTLNPPPNISGQTDKVAIDSENLKVSTCRQPVKMTRPDWENVWPYMTDRGGSGFTCPP